jgi:hypothetical protein
VAEEEKPGSHGHICLYSDEVILARTRLHYLFTIVAGIPVACGGLGLLALMAVPLAHVIAGRQTSLSFTISISVSAVLTATTVLTGTGLAIQTSRARHHKNRARELERRVKMQDEDLKQQGD